MCVCVRVCVCVRACASLHLCARTFFQNLCGSVCNMSVWMSVCFSHCQRVVMIFTKLSLLTMFMVRFRYFLVFKTEFYKEHYYKTGFYGALLIWMEVCNTRMNVWCWYKTGFYREHYLCGWKCVTLRWMCDRALLIWMKVRNTRVNVWCFAGPSTVLC